MIGAYTAICESDAMWVDQYLRETQRLGIYFAIHFDKCGSDIKNRMSRHKMCLGYTSEEKAGFSELSKQGAFDIIQKRSQFSWGLAWDMDETWGRTTPEDFVAMEKSPSDYIMLGWVNLWNDEHHVRYDGPFKNLREKMFRLRSGRWMFCSAVINGPKVIRNGRPCDASSVTRSWAITCLHWGLMTRELRELHKKRWDDVYAGKACGRVKNPYGIWNYALDEVTYPPKIDTLDNYYKG